MNFYKRVSFVCRKIPKGKAATYGQIATLCGRPSNSRQVGFALKMGLAGGVPAHRVVNSSGFLSGAKSFKTETEQKRLLVAEGVFVDEKNRVNLKKFGWKTDGTDISWFLSRFEELNI